MIIVNNSSSERIN